MATGGGHQPPRRLVAAAAPEPRPPPPRPRAISPPRPTGRQCPLRRRRARPVPMLPVLCAPPYRHVSSLARLRSRRRRRRRRSSQPRRRTHCRAAPGGPGGRASGCCGADGHRLRGLSQTSYPVWNASSHAPHPPASTAALLTAKQGARSYRSGCCCGLRRRGSEAAASLSLVPTSALVSAAGGLRLAHVVPRVTGRCAQLWLASAGGLAVSTACRRWYPRPHEARGLGRCCFDEPPSDSDSTCAQGAAVVRCSRWLALSAPRRPARIAHPFAPLRSLGLRETLFPPDGS